MKKATYIPAYYDDPTIPTLLPSDATKTIFYPVPTVDGGVIISDGSGSGCSTICELEDYANDHPDCAADLEAEIEQIKAIIAAGEGEECEPEDLEYVNEWLTIWGLDTIQ